MFISGIREAIELLIQLPLPPVCMSVFVSVWANVGCYPEIWEFFWLQSHSEHEGFKWLTILSPIVHSNAMKSENPWLDGTKGLQFHAWCPVFGLASAGRSCLPRLIALCIHIKTTKVEKSSYIYDHTAHLGEFQQNVPVQGSLQWHSCP